MTSVLSLGSAVYNTVASGTLPAFYHLAPQSQNPPYAEVILLSGIDDYTFDDKGFNASFLVKVISDRQFPLEAIQAYDTVHGILQDASISFTGYSVIRIRRESIVNYQDNERFWHVGGNYNFEVWEN